MLNELVSRFLKGDRRALARAISLAEGCDPAVGEMLAVLSALTDPQPRRVGLTGAPGAGKSTLADALIASARTRHKSVAVLAIDPSSPFSGGALLGDRLRMDAHLSDPSVYVRSMSSRGELGGLSRSAADTAWLLGAFGFDEVLVETVGAGQSQVEVLSLVDTTVVVLTPAAGDSVQLEKAGIVEIADVYVVNKTDLPGADRVVRDLQAMLSLGPTSRWRPPIVSTIADQPDRSIELLWGAIAEHRVFLDSQPEERATDVGQSQELVASLVGARIRAQVLEAFRRDGRLAKELAEARAPHLVADRLFALAIRGWQSDTGTSVS